MRPQAAHPREVVLELRQFDLQLALGATGMAGEDVQDDRRAVDDRESERRFERTLLARRELVITGDHIGIHLGGQRLQFLELARAEIAVGVWLLALLHELADDRDARRAQQLTQLGEVLGGGLGGDADGALARTSLARSILGLAVAGARALSHYRSIMAHGRGQRAS